MCSQQQMMSPAFTATMSVSLSPCSVPGHKASFTLEEDEMELGLGEADREISAILKIFKTPSPFVHRYSR